MLPDEFCLDTLRRNTDECILWPFRRDKFGYGRFNLSGLRFLAHRYVCVLAHGDPIDDRLHAAHSCRSTGCVNPRHLRWATAKENIGDDRRRDGTIPCGSKQSKILTETDVLEIRKLLSTTSISQKELAKQFGVSASIVSGIHARNRWKHI